MRFERAKDVSVRVPRSALEAIFDECDHYDHDETGGRVLGTCELDDGHLSLNVSAVIGPGPAARRTSTSFFQDGTYQEGVFRRIEEAHPSIEHLGNWHTHHVNGFPQLSGGDIETYRRTVNHANHNLPFFYALLVVAGSAARRRYDVKHYLLRREDDKVYEIPLSAVAVTDAQLLWTERKNNPPYAANASANMSERVYDRDILADFFPRVRPYASKQLGMYWRGPIDLVDGSRVELVVVERAAGDNPAYTVTLRHPPGNVTALAEHLAEREFRSARAALLTTERLLNGRLYDEARHACVRGSR